MIYFLVYLFLEVLISVNISSVIGGLLTFFEIIITALIGILILLKFRDTLFQNITAVSYNVIDLDEFQRLNLFTIVGAILLILPGFMTDIIGALMQFTLFTTMFVNRYNVQSLKKYKSQDKNITKDSNVIDVEIITKHTNSE